MGKIIKSQMTFQNTLLNTLIYSLLHKSQRVKHSCIQTEIIKDGKVCVTQGKTPLTWTKVGDELEHMALLIRRGRASAISPLSPRPHPASLPLPADLAGHWLSIKWAIISQGSRFTLRQHKMSSQEHSLHSRWEKAFFFSRNLKIPLVSDFFLMHM